MTPVPDPAPVLREELFHSEHLWLSRLREQTPFTSGAEGAPRVLVCIEGAGQVEHGGAAYGMEKGDVLLIPALVERIRFGRPTPSTCSKWDTRMITENQGV